MLDGKLELGEEVAFPGGLCGVVAADERTEVSIERCTLEPEAYELRFYNGSLVFGVVEVSSRQLLDLADWIKETLG